MCRMNRAFAALCSNASIRLSAPGFVRDSDTTGNGSPSCGVTVTTTRHVMPPPRIRSVRWCAATGSRGSCAPDDRSYSTADRSTDLPTGTTRGQGSRTRTARSSRSSVRILGLALRRPQHRLHELRSIRQSEPRHDLQQQSDRSLPRGHAPSLGVKVCPASERPSSRHTTHTIPSDPTTCCSSVCSHTAQIICSPPPPTRSRSARPSRRRAPRATPRCTGSR